MNGASLTFSFYVRAKGIGDWQTIETDTACMCEGVTVCVCAHESQNSSLFLQLSLSPCLFRALSALSLQYDTLTIASSVRLVCKELSTRPVLSHCLRARANSMNVVTLAVYCSHRKWHVADACISVSRPPARFQWSEGKPIVFDTQWSSVKSTRESERVTWWRRAMALCAEKYLRSQKRER